MAQHKLSRGKRFAKPVLFGSIIVGLATAFFNRHWFLDDVEDLRAQERARHEARRIEILQRRERQLADVYEKKKGGSD